MKTIEKARFGTRLPKGQTKIIVNEHNKILSSERDQKIFSNAIMNPQKPNEKLRSAVLKEKKL